MANVTLVRMWAGEGRGEGKQVEPLSLGRHREGLAGESENAE